VTSSDYGSNHALSKFLLDQIDNHQFHLIADVRRSIMGKTNPMAP